MANSIVVYFSASGNTGRIAKKIQDITGSDILELEPIEEYPSSYDDLLDVAKKQINGNETIELKEYDIGLAGYDVIYIGTPNWWGTIAPPVTAFLSENDLANKIICPFITHGGGGKGNSQNDIMKLCPDSDVKEVLAISGSGNSRLQNDVENWI